MLTSQAKSGILTLALFGQSPFGGIAQLARARGSYPRCPRFKSRCSYHAADVLQHGPLVKWLRHRPFTAVTRVRVSYGSPTPYGERHQGQTWRHSSAGRALASHARGHRFEFCCLHQNPEAVRLRDFFIASRNGKRDDGVREERLSPALGRRDESPSSRGPQCVAVLCFCCLFD